MKKKQKGLFQKVQIRESNGKVKTIGKYNKELKVFECERLKSEHFFRKYNSWALDKATIEFLVEEDAIIRLKDKESKWKFQAKAKDFIIEGQVVEYKPHRPQYLLPIGFWEVLKAKSRTCVISCKEITCMDNFAGLCLRGGIDLDEDGKCTQYEERPIEK